jgi:hypothetical protein
VLTLGQDRRSHLALLLGSGILLPASKGFSSEELKAIEGFSSEELKAIEGATG